MDTKSRKCIVERCERDAMRDSAFCRECLAFVWKYAKHPVILPKSLLFARGW